MIGNARLLGALAVVASLAAAAAATGASFGPRPVASVTRSHPKPCGKGRRRGCHYIEISSFSWGVSRGTVAPPAGAAGREGSTPGLGEVTVRKPKRKGH
jgi:hypothetical protein